MAAGAMDKGSGESKGTGKGKGKYKFTDISDATVRSRNEGYGCHATGFFFAEHRQGVGMEKQHSTQVTGLRQTGGGT